MNDEGATCERCSCTGNATGNAIGKLERVLAPLGIKVSLERTRLDQATFSSDPLQSNRIWINGKTLEDWVGRRHRSEPVLRCLRRFPVQNA